MACLVSVLVTVASQLEDTGTAQHASFGCSLHMPVKTEPSNLHPPKVSALERKISTSHWFFECAKASGRPFKKSSESSSIARNEANFLLSRFRRFNSLLCCSLQPCLLCASCLRFAPLCVLYLQLLSSRFQFDGTRRSLPFRADLAGISRSQTHATHFTAVHDGAFLAIDFHQD